jgi:hypothetical protein
MQEYTGTCVKFLLTWPKTGIFLPLPKGGSCEKIPPEKTRIHRNPEESWAGTKNRDLEMDIPETGKHYIIYCLLERFS